MMSPDPVVKQYNKLAERYDSRWSFYLQASLAETQKRLDLQTGESLLDVGCGSGLLLESLSRTSPGADLYGVEPSLAMLAAARRKLGDKAILKQGQAEKLPFPDQSFDIVVSTSALHLFQYPLAALVEMKRVLRPGGRVVITDWCGDYLTCRLYDRWLRLVDSAHNKTLGRGAIHRLLHEAGFTGIRVDRYRINWFWGLMTATAVLSREEQNEAGPDYTRKRGIRAM